MAFDTLPEIIQIAYNHSYTTFFKFCLLFICLVVSILVIRKFKPKKSKYLMVSKVRLTYYVLAWVYVISFPFQLGFLSNSVPLSVILNPIILFYTLNFIVLGIILALNILWHGSGFVTELFGNEDENRISGVKADFNKYLK